MRDVYLFRILMEFNQSLGSLSCCGDKEVNVFKTLELGWHDNQKNISCIPSGAYKCRWTKSPLFSVNAGVDVYTYELMDVQDRGGIRIHSANYYTQLKGCIALGDAHKDINADAQLDVIHSGDSVKKFAQLMEFKDFLLHII